MKKSPYTYLEAHITVDSGIAHTDAMSNILEDTDSKLIHLIGDNLDDHMITRRIRTEAPAMILQKFASGRDYIADSAHDNGVKDSILRVKVEVDATRELLENPPLYWEGHIHMLFNVSDKQYEDVRSWILRTYESLNPVLSFNADKLKNGDNVAIITVRANNTVSQTEFVDVVRSIPELYLHSNNHPFPREFFTEIEIEGVLIDTNPHRDDLWMQSNTGKRIMESKTSTIEERLKAHKHNLLQLEADLKELQEEINRLNVLRSDIQSLLNSFGKYVKQELTR